MEMLSNCRISAYKYSIDDGFMDVYSGNSYKGDYIFVAEKEAERAKQIIEEYNFSREGIELGVKVITKRSGMEGFAEVFCQMQ